MTFFIYLFIIFSLVFAVLFFGGITTIHFCSFKLFYYKITARILVLARSIVFLRPCTKELAQRNIPVFVQGLKQISINCDRASTKACIFLSKPPLLRSKASWALAIFFISSATCMRAGHRSINHHCLHIRVNLRF